ncbi:hypothetical protein K469DRAFT_754043 [Zopfia rhizophila CBS 207.26]|uniref:Uncharacterized protein n=1 Tax=Zopfia rhizophila CBS 207.26 TaxID=1314779 RepID=A0A6A6DIG6_9PEZI|nr:hypothetical protein K469DRAFT_754043 [Zopfia rhizophila CBS 207.26]
MSTSQAPVDDDRHITPPSSFVRAPLTPPPAFRTSSMSCRAFSRISKLEGQPAIDAAAKDRHRTDTAIMEGPISLLMDNLSNLEEFLDLRGLARNRQNADVTLANTRDGTGL